MRYVIFESALPSLRTVVLRPKARRCCPCRRWQSTTAADVDGAKDHYIHSDDGFRTLRARQYGNNPLPLPPFMDPALVEAKERYAQRKQDAEKDLTRLTPFQRELRTNVYAQALTTPIRQCASTRARLPKHFLVKFRLQISPKHKTDSSSRTASQETRPKMNLVPVNGGIGTYIIGAKTAIQHISRSKKSLAVFWTAPVARHYESTTGKSGQNIKPNKDLGWDAQMPSIIERELIDRLLRAIADLAVNDLLANDLAMGTEESASKEQSLHVQDAAALIQLGHDVEETHMEARTEEVTSRGLLTYDLTKLITPEELNEWRSNVDIKTNHVYIRKSSSEAVLRAAERLQNYISSFSTNSDGHSSAHEAEGSDDE